MLSFRDYSIYLSNGNIGKNDRQKEDGKPLEHEYIYSNKPANKKLRLD